MSRSITGAALQSLFSQDTAEVWLVLLDIDHSTLPTPIRVVNDTKNITSNGNVYTAFPFDISIPADIGERLANVKLTISNVTRTLIQTLRTIEDSPTVDMNLVLASDPDNIQAGPFEMRLHDVTYDTLSITGTLGFEDILNEPFPADTYRPANFPSVFT